MSNQPETAPPIPARIKTARPFRWLRNVWGLILLALAGIAGLVALWYGYEDWRGRRAWNQYREAAEARGESFDWTAYIPKPVPDDRNFAATPFLKSFFKTNNSKEYWVILTNDLYFRAASNITETNIVKDSGHRHFTDLVAWQLASAALHSGRLMRAQKFETDKTGLAARAAAAPAVLEGMKSDQAVFAELRAASTREFSRYPVNYAVEDPWSILLPHLGRIREVCRHLSLEACADLAAGRTDEALSDVKLILSLTDSVKSEPDLIAYLVRMACVSIATQPVWEGLAEHRWTEAQLHELQARFLSCNFLADIQHPLQMERACGVVTVDFFRKHGVAFLNSLGNSDSENASPFEEVASSLVFKAMPSGWYDQEKLNYCKLSDVQWEGVVDLGARVVSPDKVESNSNEFHLQIYGPPPGSAGNALLRHRLIAAMLLPNLSKLPDKIAAAQTIADQAALACALERYRLANGQFPETLDALTPQFMSRPPHDVITGQPYKYRRTEDGQFILYSVGWNEKDDGGAPGKTLFDKTQGDWVWQYPALLP